MVYCPTGKPEGGVFVLIDLHCHILPGVDDGPDDLEESLAMARHAVKDGIHTIVATPHALGGTFPNPPDKILNAASALRRRLETERIPYPFTPARRFIFVRTWPPVYWPAKQPSYVKTSGMC